MARKFSLEQFLDEVLTQALTLLTTKKTRIYTFAFYHDHESDAVSVCADTRANSQEQVARQNAFSAERFSQSIANEDLEMAAICQANTGRNLSLGDFAYVNIARTDLTEATIDDRFYLAMVVAVMHAQERVVALADDRDELLLCCSSANAEVGFTWLAEQEP